MDGDDAYPPPRSGRPLVSRALSGRVRSRSPTSESGGTTEKGADGRPAAKRTRKAINCEPCRTSKLKCDRNRPCSSCVLRGTTLQCYQADGSAPQDGYSSIIVNPAQEIANLRRSITLLESHIFPNPSQRNRVSGASITMGQLAAGPAQDESYEAEYVGKNQVLDALASDRGGLYVGPTSAATLLICDTVPAEPLKDTEEQLATNEYDRDLVKMLPPLEIIDQLIDYYFDYCNWIYRSVNQPFFLKAWDRFKSGQSADRVVLATVCVILGVVVQYLPDQHSMLRDLSGTNGELANKYYDIMRVALQRQALELTRKTWTLDFVELLLIRAHFQILRKTDSEEIWSVTGELVTVAKAMGLHRDPVRWRMSKSVAERRRWAWWNILTTDRLQAFMFGRPTAIASHHFDTQLPLYCDPAIDPTGRLYLPNIAIFRLAYILGEVMNDAVSLRPVSYASVLEHDRVLGEWLQTLPPELDLDEVELGRHLTSPFPHIRRLGIQSVAIRATCQHVRFTLHRPYSIPNTNNYKSSSLEAAVKAANRVIWLIAHTRTNEFLASDKINVPGHMSLAPFHLFSASMFFAFQLFQEPGHPSANDYRANVQNAMTLLGQARCFPIAEKSYSILEALSPVIFAEGAESGSPEFERLRVSVMKRVRALAFPYHDSANFPGSSGNSPSSGKGSADSGSPPGFGQRQHLLPPLSSLRDPDNHILPTLPSYMLTPALLQPAQSQDHIGLPSQASYDPYAQQTYEQPADADQTEVGAWGASVGFGPGEWSSLMEAMRSAPATEMGAQ